MSHYAEVPSTVPSAGARGTSGWVGWIGFAGIAMVMLGAFHIFEGIVALANNQYFVVRSSDLVVSVNYTAWGWLHIVGGAVVLAAGFGVFTGLIWARVVGTLVALLSAVVNLVFLPAYPIWSMMMIALDVIVIMALTVHGSEIRAGE